MENKLLQIQQELFEQGLSKGRAEGERIESEARERAKAIVAEAEREAGQIVRRARSDAEELHKNSLTEISLAGREAVRRIKDEISSLIVARSLSDGVHRAGIDPAFTREILLDIARGWQGGSGKVALSALLPADRQAELDKAFADSAAALLKEGIEVGYSAEVRTGFKVGEKGGGYYIGFSDENFEALLGQYLREKVATILYGTK